MRYIFLGLAIIIFLIFAGCGDGDSQKTGKVHDISNKPALKPDFFGEVKHVPIDAAHEIEGEILAKFDPNISHDGNGSMRYYIEDSTIVNVAILDDVDVENGRFYYKAWLKTDEFEGKVFLEMRLSFGTFGSFYTRDQYTPLTGTVDWQQEDCYLKLGKGKNPTRVILQMNVDGKGTVWIDDISLVRAPLK